MWHFLEFVACSDSDGGPEVSTPTNACYADLMIDTADMIDCKERGNNG